MKLLNQLSVVGLCILCLFSSSFAQVEQGNCGTDRLHKARVQSDSVYRNFVSRIKQQIAEMPPDKAYDGTVYTIPVVFVVYHLGEAVGTGSNVSDVALQAQINLMNQMYAGQTAIYPGARANIQFTLALRTPDCQPFSGIVRIDGRVVPNYQTSGADGGTIDNGLRQLSGQFSTSSAENFVVVRVVHKIEESGMAGYAFFGGDMFVNANSMNSAGTYNNLLSHEMGHVLFMYHTFEGSSTSTPGSYICPTNANPASDGDAVADTDPHKQNEPGNCFFQATPQSITTINTCMGLPFGWIGNNIMSYGCYRNRFTQGQVDRMRLFLTTDNRVLGLSNFGTAPSAADALTAATCSVSALNGNDAGYSAGIVRYRFGGMIDKSSNYYPYYTGYYQNYACTDRAVVTAGSSYTFAITAYSFAQANYRRIYIDYNNNGTFDESTELAFVSASNGNTGSITIPITAIRNVYLRMRVVINNGTVAPSACQITGSSTYGYGEIEDYGLLIQSPPCTSATATLTGSQTVALGQVASLTTTLTGTSPWSLTLSTGQSVSNITTSPYIFTVTPGTSTTYTLTRVSNLCGTGTVAGSASVTVQAPPCLVMYTLRNGLWTDPTVWSCGRVPLNTDLVEIGHQITIPAGEARAKQVRYTTGKVIFGEGGRLLLSQ